MVGGSEARARLAFWAVLIASAGILTLCLHSVPLLDPDEARFARTAVEMFRRGDLVVPTFEGQPRLVKPPLVHWLQVFFFARFGISPWAARLHSVLATLASVVLVAWIARRRYGEEGALWAAASLATMPLVAACGRLGTLDALLALHVLAVVGLDMTGARERASYSGLASGAVMGLAFLIKGPVGIVLPLLLMMAGRTAAGREVVPRRTTVLAATAGCCAVVLPWALAFVRRVGFDTALGTLHAEAFERFFAGRVHNEPIWFYLPIVLVGFLPWSLPLVAGLGRAVRERRDPASATARYSGAALVVGVLFFTASRSKLANYLLPLAPFAALVVAWEVGREIKAASRSSLMPQLFAGAIAALALVLASAGVSRLEGDERAFAWVGAAVLGAGATAALGGLLAQRPRLVYGASATACAGLLLAAACLLHPAIGQRRSTRELVSAIPQLASGRPVVTVDMRVPSLTFYLDRPVEVVGLAALGPRLERSDDPLFVAGAADLSRLPDPVRRRLQEIGRQGKYRVFEKAKEPVP